VRVKKQSMRQLKDAAEHERTVRAVEAIGSIALEVAAKRNVEKPRYFRGALIKTKVGV
jgi:hypothetical protein